MITVCQIPKATIVVLVLNETLFYFVQSFIQDNYSDIPYFYFRYYGGYRGYYWG